MLLAHPDDELMCLPLFFEPGKKFLLFFICNQNLETDKRFREATNSAIKLKSRGINVKLMISPVSFLDGSGYKSIEREKIFPLVEFFDQLNVNSLITFAYEGGHQDHDLCNVIGSFINLNLGIPITYFSGYRSSGFSKSFSLMNPIKKSKFVKKKSGHLIRLSLCLLYVYRRQWKTWIFLAPPLLLKYAFRPWHQSGVSLIQDGNVERFLYEIRLKADPKEVEARFKEFLKSDY